MRILVMSQVNAEEYAKGIHKETSAIISIVSLNDNNANIIQNDANNIKDILRLKFDDTDDMYGMKYEDAEMVSVFVKNNVNCDRIIVHCGAGQSRSAGVAGAIMKYWFNTDNEIFNNKRYTPNMRCYRFVLNALNECI